MLLINYINQEEKTTPYIYITIDGNSLKYSMTEDGSFIKELKSYETYYVLYRNTKIEDIPQEDCFENRLFGNKRVRIVSKAELRQVYNVKNYSEILDNVISETSVKRYALICTGFINIEKNIFNAVLCVYGNADALTVKTNYDVSYQGYEDDTTFIDSSYDSLLWNSYSLTVNGIEYKNDCNGKALVERDITLSPIDDCLEFKIQKYNKMTFDSIANDESDNDELFVYINKNGDIKKDRVQLENGCGNFVVKLDEYKGVLDINLEYNKRSIVSDYEFIV